MSFRKFLKNSSKVVLWVLQSQPTIAEVSDFSIKFRLSSLKMSVWATTASAKIELHAPLL